MPLTISDLRFSMDAALRRVAAVHCLNPKSLMQIEGPPRRNPRSIVCALSVLCVFISISALAAPQEQSGEFLLVRRSMQVDTIRLAAISDQTVEHQASEGKWERTPLNECIALVNPSAKMRPRSTGLVILADGQRLPGELALGANPPPDTLAWAHPWLGRIDVPLDLISTALFNGNASAPPPAQLDVVLLANGDHREGLILALGGDAITLEVERGGARQNIEIPLNITAAVTTVAPQKKPAATSKRIWFDEGTVIDVQSIAVGDDGFVRLSGSALVSGTQPTRVGLSQVAAILLDPLGMVPLASIAPSRIEGPPTRYVLPRPVLVDPSAPLALSAIDFRGPIVVRYMMPVGAQRFTAEAELPHAALALGDYELVIRSNDTEVSRTRLNAQTPRVTINVPLNSGGGRELTIELVEGANGPIQDQLILQRPMLLMSAR
jgi:hypothetical protein